MTSRERVARAIEFRCPDRLPSTCSYPGRSDVFHAHSGQKLGPEAGTRRRWRVHGPFRLHLRRSEHRRTMDSPPTFRSPTSATWTATAFQILSTRPAWTRSARRFAKRTTCTSHAISSGSRSSSGMHLHPRVSPRHSEDLYLRRDLMETLADRVMDYDVAAVRELDRALSRQDPRHHHERRLGQPEADIHQRRPVRRVLHPALPEALRRRSGTGGCTCGSIPAGMVVDFLPPLIEAGVQGINLQQPRIFDLRESGAPVRGLRMLQMSPVDIQATMPSRERARRSAKRPAVLSHHSARTAVASSRASIGLQRQRHRPAKGVVGVPGLPGGRPVPVCGALRPRRCGGCGAPARAPPFPLTPAVWEWLKFDWLS